MTRADAETHLFFLDEIERSKGDPIEYLRLLTEHWKWLCELAEDRLGVNRAPTLPGRPGPTVEPQPEPEETQDLERVDVRLAALRTLLGRRPSDEQVEAWGALFRAELARMGQE